MLARLFAAAVTVFALTAPAHAQLSKDSKTLAPFKPVVAKAYESTVRIKCNDKDTILGTIVDADGFILTKLSELKGVLFIRMPDGAEYEGTIVAAHKPTDLALVKVDAKGLKAVRFADTKKLPAGHLIAASGPTSDPVSVGIVSVMTRKLTGRDAIILNPNRGLLGIYPEDEKDEDGKPLGAKIARIAPGGAAERAGFATGDVIFEMNGKKIAGQTELREFLESFQGGDVVTVKAKHKGEVKEFKVTLGSAQLDRIGITPADEKDGEGNMIGVKVTAATSGGAAAKAGLLVGDIICEMNGKKIDSQIELRELLDGLKSGDVVVVKAKRKGETKDFKVTISVPQLDRGDMQNAMGSVLSGRRTGFSEVLQTDMVVDAKDCGGPVVDLDGNVLGINIARAGRVETWVLPSEVIRPLLPELKAGKFAPAARKLSTPALPGAPAPRVKGSK
jgi:S1-C subfamily serine protease